MTGDATQKPPLATRWVERLWYTRNPCAFLLLPFSWLYCWLVRLRQALYRCGVLKSHRVGRPVIVVGNITVGGTGKTPLVIWIAEWLQRHGYRPGVISRGYGGRAKQWPQAVGLDSDPAAVGDEPCLIRQRTGCPVMVDPVRVRAARGLVDSGCDIIVADDGLQHYALARDIEVAVVDGVRRFGNGRCLPAGPLREPVRRLNRVDVVVCNGTAQSGETSMQLVGDTAVNLSDRSLRTLAAFARQPVHVVVGIGHPQRFLDHLATFALHFDVRVFPDHHPYRREDIVFEDEAPVLMTEKDGVKCRAFAGSQHWCVPVSARLGADFGDRLLALLQDINRGQETA